MFFLFLMFAFNQISLTLQINLNIPLRYDDLHAENVKIYHHEVYNFTLTHYVPIHDDHAFFTPGFVYQPLGQFLSTLDLFGYVLTCFFVFVFCI